MARILSEAPGGLILPAKSLWIPQNNLVVPNGLVNYWPLSYNGINLASNKLEDISNSGRGFSLDIVSVTGANLADTPLGGGIAFDGSTNYALTATAALSSAEMGLPFSISCWVNAATLTGTQLFLTLGGSGSSNTYLGFRTDQGSNFVFTADGSSSFAKSNVSPSTGRYYFLTGVKASGTADLYVNGVDQTATGISYSTTPPSDSTVIAAAVSTGAKGNATIFECRIYNRALDASEVLELYQTGLAGRRDRISGWSASEMPALQNPVVQFSGTQCGRQSVTYLQSYPQGLRLPGAATSGIC